MDNMSKYLSPKEVKQMKEAWNAQAYIFLIFGFLIGFLIGELLKYLF